MDLDRRLPHTDPSRFSMVPRSDVPRSKFKTKHALKTTFDAGYLVPIEANEVLPGDVHRGRVSIFARLANIIFPLMDNVVLETFFFFIPNRLVWTNWAKMMGERADPGSSISFTVPQVVSDPGGWNPNTLQDYMGIPEPSNTGQPVEVNALPFRGYYFVYNEWFRDQNLQSSLVYTTGDTSAGHNDFVLQRRNKRHDYFTSALPWPLKGGVDVTLPLTGNATVRGIAVDSSAVGTAGNPTAFEAQGTAASGWTGYFRAADANEVYVRSTAGAAVGAPVIYADLSTVTGQTINALRLAFQTQRLLERDARSGTRYTELLRAHFGVTPEDSRLQRPEYIGGGRTSFNTQAIPQTSATGLTGGTQPLGALGGTSTASDQHSFSYSATEHGFILGLVHVTAEITYQQGLHRMWTRQTRYDYYWPVFAHLGEQAIRRDEIFLEGTAASDTTVFGYQERWAEYRHRTSRITGLFNSTRTGNIDEWHLAQEFGSAPALNSTFIQDTPPFSRVLAAGVGANGMQILFDSLFDIEVTRALPMYSVPGQIDRL